MTQQTQSWRRRVMLFFISQCITLFGSQIVQMAIVWHVTLTTGSGAWVAAFSVCSYLPQFFISFIGGVWADRYSRKRLIIAADVLIAAVTLAMLLVMPHIADDAWLLSALLIMSVIRSAGAGIQHPAVNAVIPQLVPEDSLMRYNGLNAAMQSAVQFAAPAAAAALLTASSLRAALSVDVITAVIGVGMFACVALPDKKKAQPSPSLLADAGIGVRYAWSYKAVRKALTVYGLFIFLTVPAGYLSGLLVSRIFGDTYWHLTAVELVGFGGMMLGGLLTGCLGISRNRSRTLAVGLALFGMMAAAMGLTQRFALYLVFMALYGVALTAVQTTITTMLQESAETSMRGRVFGLMSSLYAGCYPIGMALFGPMADMVPLQGIMIASGVALLVLAAAAGREPAQPTA